MSRLKVHVSNAVEIAILIATEYLHFRRDWGRRLRLTGVSAAPHTGEK